METDCLLLCHLSLVPVFLEPRGIQRTEELGPRQMDRYRRGAVDGDVLGTGEGPLMVMSVMLSGQCRGVAWDVQGSEILGHHSPMMFNSWKVDSDLSKGWLMGMKG